MIETFEEKFNRIKSSFTHATPQLRYELLIQMGRSASVFNPAWKIPEKIVPGCQSILYLHAEVREGKVLFYSHSDALISSGLAALLIFFYSGEKPEFILQTPPLFLKELGIENALSPNRSNGLYNIHLRMKQESLKFLLSTHR